MVSKAMFLLFLGGADCYAFYQGDILRFTCFLCKFDFSEALAQKRFRQQPMSWKRHSSTTWRNCWCSRGRSVLKYQQNQPITLMPIDTISHSKQLFPGENDNAADKRMPSSSWSSSWSSMSSSWYRSSWSLHWPGFHLQPYQVSACRNSAAGEKPLSSWSSSSSRPSSWSLRWSSNDNHHGALVVNVIVIVIVPWQQPRILWFWRQYTWWASLSKWNWFN